MKKTKALAGPVHKLPDDFRKMLHLKKAVKENWEGLTPLAQNEWICWVTSAKKEETRLKRMHRAQEDMLAGKRRPCCWPGCPHRNPNTAKWFKGKKPA